MQRYPHASCPDHPRAQSAVSRVAHSPAFPPTKAAPFAQAPHLKKRPILAKEKLNQCTVGLPFFLPALRLPIMTKLILPTSLILVEIGKAAPAASPRY